MDVDVEAIKETDFWEQLTSFVSFEEIPTRAEYVDSLVNLGALQGLVLLALGVVYMLYGWQAFKTFVVINACVIGAFIGAYLGGLANTQSMQIIGAVSGMVLLGALALPLIKYAVGVMGAIGGSFLGYGLWHYGASLSGNTAVAQYAWAGALIGLITLGMLAFVIFRESIIIITALQGSFMAVSGALTLVMKVETIEEFLHQHLVTNIHLLPLLIALPALAGLACQHSSKAKKARKKAKAAA